jgi:nicotinic acid mononucleotide adenylyltransferase
VIGAYPGTFNPPTVAHLAIAHAALARVPQLDRLDLVLSRAPLGKDDLDRPSVDERATVLRAALTQEPRLWVAISEARLIVDVAVGYGVLVVGADKWAQIVDPAWYGGSDTARDDAVARLPGCVLVVPRGGSQTPELPAGAELLAVDDDHLHVSSTRVRAGEHELMLPAARASGLWAPAS